jgi:hypothetical protein
VPKSADKEMAEGVGFGIHYILGSKVRRRREALLPLYFE